MGLIIQNIYTIIYMTLSYLVHRLVWSHLSVHLRSSAYFFFVNQNRSLMQQEDIRILQSADKKRRWSKCLSSSDLLTDGRFRFLCRWYLRAPAQCVQSVGLLDCYQLALQHCESAGTNQETKTTVLLRSAALSKSHFISIASNNQSISKAR